MKKQSLALVLIVVLILGGCQRSSNFIFSYQEHISSSNNDTGIDLSENNFFSQSIVTISDEAYVSDNELIGSTAALLFDISNSKAIYYKNPYERLYPASLTKLMTALVVLKRGELTDSVTISHNAANISVPGAKVCGFREGDIVSLDSLLHCLLIYSGNDAGIAIAEHLSGSEEGFVKIMNSEALKLGASHTNFVNSHGLHDDNHYSTAYDMYLIFNELIQYDVFVNIINQDSYTASFKDKDGKVKELNFKTTNLYLRNEKEAPEGVTIVGGKTGVTSKAGNCLVLLLKDSNNVQYISLILKATSRDQLYSDMDSLFPYIVEEN
ncbi:MAG: D-alanyl-D-alanine carboxypeptidase [Clostridiales bacterium]|jgi:D-alanyl-D-alanine carboxypeptidase|nr:serine hydrolase [Bacillota bacterium]NLK03574.1 D-alanyl-D-alanine carboxypeptidase [Clostridiales bacterium]